MQIGGEGGSERFPEKIREGDVTHSVREWGGFGVPRVSPACAALMPQQLTFHSTDRTNETGLLKPFSIGSVHPSFYVALRCVVAWCDAWWRCLSPHDSPMRSLDCVSTTTTSDRRGD